jgi:hypothetical protein
VFSALCARIAHDEYATSHTTVTEFLERGSLAHVLHKSRVKTTPRLMARMCTDIAAALAFVQ